MRSYTLLPTSFLSSENPRSGSHQREEIEPFPFSAELLIGLCFVLALGFFGTQKLIHTLFNPSSAYNFYSINESACENGFRVPFLACKKPELAKPENLDTVQQVPKKVEDSTDTLDQTSLIIGMNASTGAPDLRTQFAYLPNLSSALSKLSWNNGDEQDAVRLLTIMSTLQYGRQRESHLVQSSSTKILGPVWNKYPEIVAASSCLYCGMFYNNVLKPYMTEGTENTEHLNTLALGHPRFLQAIYASGQLNIDEFTKIGFLQAELLHPGDYKTAKFIGDLLLKHSKIDLLHTWSSRGGNSSYAISEYQSLIQLPQALIIDSWQAGVARGSDNSVLTRYLISTGYRPALRWLLWLHAGNLSYLQDRQYKLQRDRYNDFLVDEYLDFPKESHDDLTGFYSKNWQNITWRAEQKKWVYIKP